MLRWLIAGLALACISVASFADSTINPLVPADNSALSSAILRQQFQAAINDINTLQGLTGKISAPAGVVADSTTDISGPLNAALATGDVWLPSTIDGSFYRAASTITVPYGSTLRGVGNSSQQASGSTKGGARIVCDAGVSPCIKLGTGEFNTEAAIYNITQSRAGGTPNSALIGIWIIGGYNDRLVDVQSDNNGINFLWGRSTIGAGSGLSHMATRLVSSRASSVHMSFDGIPDVRINESHIGVNGTTDYNATAAFRFTCTQHDCTGGGGANTIIVDNTQVNQAFNRIEYLFDFVDADPTFSATYAIFHFSNLYAESIGHLMHSDSSWKRITEFRLINSSITTNTTTAQGLGGTYFVLDPATAVDRWYFTNNTLYSVNAPYGFRLNPAPASGSGISELHISNSSMYGDFYLTGFNGSTAAILGTTFSTNYTIDGSWAYYNEMGTNIGGSYSESAGSNTAIFNNRQTKIGSTVGVTCAAGVTAGTVTVKNGVVTHC